MTTLEINGKRVQVDDSFLKLSPEEQERTVNEIAAQMGAEPKPQRSFGETLRENIIGSGAIDTPGERLGATVNDMGKSLGSGFVRGATALADLPGEAFNAVGNLGVSALEAVGVGPQAVEAARQSLTFGPFETGVFGRAADTVAPNVRSYQPQTTAGEYTQTVGEFLPGGVLAKAPIAAGVVPGLVSEFAGQSTEGMKFPSSMPFVGGGDVEPWARAGGALLGPTVAEAGRRVVTPNAADPARLAMADRLRAEGVPLTAGQRTGNVNLQYQEAMSPRTVQLLADQGDDFTAAVLRRIGVNAKRAEPEVLNAAGQRIGGMFDDLAARNNIAPDAQLLRDVRSALNTYKANTNKNSISPIVENITLKIRRALGSRQPITGAQYQQFRSELGPALKGSDGQLREAAKAIRLALDDAMERSLRAAGNTDDLALYGQARQQYRDLLAIEGAVSRAGEGAAYGVINPRQLRAEVVRIQGKRSYTTGQSDLGELARAGNATMTPLPQSGTQPRMMANTIQALSGSGAGVGAGGLAYLLTKDPTIAAAAGAAGAVAPMARNQFIGSRVGQGYLANQLLPEGGDMATQALIAGISALAQEENRKKDQRN